MATWICGEGHIVDWNAWSALATFVAAAVALWAAVYGPTLQIKAMAASRQKEDRRKIAAFIKEFEAALSSVFARTVFSPLDIDRGEGNAELTPEEILATGALTDDARIFFKKMRSQHLLYDIADGEMVIKVCDQIFQFERDCIFLAERLRTPARHDRKRIKTTICAQWS